MANHTWFRCYTEITRDRKLRRLPYHARWVWIALMSIAKESPKPGSLLLSDNVPVIIEDIADEAAVTITEAEESLEMFKKQSMVTEDDGVLKLINWHKRNFDSDSSTERVRKHRTQDNETLQKRYRNVTETPPDTDTDTDTDTDNNKKNTPAKISYAEFVSMTNDEHSSLVTKYGADFTRRCIDKLDNYKGANGKRYKSDYRAILNWVVKEVQKGDDHNGRTAPDRKPDKQHMPEWERQWYGLAETKTS